MPTLHASIHRQAPLSPTVAASVEAAVIGEHTMRIIRLPEVERKTGFKHTTLYMLMNEGRFPRSVPLGNKARGWLESEVDDWIRERIAARDGATVSTA
jgi:prophage regulatory protein